MSNINFFENEVIEFKKTTGELKEGIISIVSILNKHQSGKLYFVVKDNGEIIGQDVSPKTIREVSKAISENIEPKIYPTVNKVKLDDKECILVEFEGDDMPYLAYGRAYMRVGDEDRQLSMKEIRRIILKAEDEVEKWENKISGFTTEDIDEELLKKFVEKGRKAKRINFLYTNKEEILKKLSVVNKNGELLNAGYILFSKEAKLEMQMAIFATETKLTFLDIDQVFGNIFELIEIGESYIRKNIKWPVNFKSGSMERVEIPEIPLEAIREALINSLIHRDMKNPKSNEIAIYKNRVEIFNPGEFPEGFIPEDFIEGQGSIPKNPLVANTLYLSKDIEKWGSGFRRITDACADANVKVKFEIRKNGFLVVFYRKTDGELFDLTQENKNHQENHQENPKKLLKRSEENYIIEFCNEAKNLKEIAEYCGYKDIKNFRERYINPLLKCGKLKMTIPEHPKNRNQKYISTSQQ